ncbi:hypothetical protein XNC1_2281 [Xenorhabdus nematophila ATCC 19061]|uniref:Uncharacterized protein n=1 Tax=Xenorhabdus nematophila (strain ATCC 19061 / DSM 3370 / CCUG 14189 / LMG 1036 / NCIMB 9965 / AN6) TaxID=406817 RepID=D3VFM6_XENNA|nr:hypothetical protein XNC1_2281 [Xenorhabdus nematophila ATCC 19061]CEK23196.1 hypothetical protein XNC2_2202 [Xenorhabdus nematophila AN6/1]
MIYLCLYTVLIAQNIISVTTTIPEYHVLQLAQQFTEMLKSKLFFEKLYMPEISITEEQIKEQVDLCSDIIASYIENLSCGA